MRFSLSILLTLHYICSQAQGTDEKSCHTNVELNIVIDTVYHNFDSLSGKNSYSGQVDYGCYCNPCYVLRPINTKFKVVSFKIISETTKEIIERPYSGDIISCSSGMVEISRARKGSKIFFECIKAKHENGNIYILKDFFILKQ